MSKRTEWTIRLTVAALLLAYAIALAETRDPYFLWRWLLS